MPSLATAHAVQKCLTPARDLERAMRVLLWPKVEPLTVGPASAAVQDGALAGYGQCLIPPCVAGGGRRQRHVSVAEQAWSADGQAALPRPRSAHRRSLSLGVHEVRHDQWVKRLLLLVLLLVGGAYVWRQEVEAGLQALEARLPDVALDTGLAVDVIDIGLSLVAILIATLALMIARRALRGDEEARRRAEADAARGKRPIFQWSFWEGVMAYRNVGGPATHCFFVVLDHEHVYKFSGAISGDEGRIRPEVVAGATSKHASSPGHWKFVVAIARDVDGRAWSVGRQAWAGSIASGEEMSVAEKKIDLFEVEGLSLSYSDFR